MHRMAWESSWFRLVFGSGWGEHVLGGPGGDDDIDMVSDSPPPNPA